MHTQHLLVLDPIAFRGGSKIATENILHLLDTEQVRVTVLSADPDSWCSKQFTRVKLIQPRWFAKQDKGISYFVRHIYIAMLIVLTRLRFGKINTALGASGPGIDLSLYLVKRFFDFRVIQLVHGPVARSNTITRCLSSADQVHYLPSTRDSIVAALARTNTGNNQHLSPPRFFVMQNGLPGDNWPSPCQYETPGLFWAASLLKWKGLDTAVKAIEYVEPELRPPFTICYIKPKDTSLPISQAPIELESVTWIENPDNIDALRAQANIFISTSDNEPFGLSILEAMAAGHCVVIPADSAYWDQVLVDGRDCIKYRPGDAWDLSRKLRCLTGNLPLVHVLGQRAKSVASTYRASTRYATIIQCLLQNGDIIVAGAQKTNAGSLT